VKKLISLLLTTICVCIFANSQANITVNVNSVLRSLSGNENGINLNYLVDGNLISSITNTTTALQNMKVKMLRYPGGEKSDNYFFSASPWTGSSPRMALTDAACYWPTNDPTYVDQASPNKLCKPEVLDFDEFMTMCNSLGAQPLIVVAYDGMYNSLNCAKPTKAQLITHAAEWVRYANITRGYNAKYWMIGNESWNQPSYNGQTTPVQYAIDITDFAAAMKAVDPSIKIIANGKSGWWQTLLQSPAASNIDFLAFSEYPTYNYTGGYDYYRTNNVNLTPETNAAINDLNTYGSTADKARIKVIPAEFNSIDWSGSWSNDNNLGHALANFQMFGDMVVKPKVETACMWNTRWINNVASPQHINDALDANGNMNANGLAQSVWGSLLLQNMVSTSSSSNSIRVFASYNNISKKLNIAILNKENTSQIVNTGISNFVSSFAGSRWELKGTSANDKFPSYTKLINITTPSQVSSITVPANSVTVLYLQDVSTLPLQVSTFNGSRLNSHNTLYWKVEGEENTERYEVERSFNGNHFSLIGTLVKNELKNGEYKLTDYESNSFQYLWYRLRIVNSDGSTVYSKTIKLTTAGTEKFSFTIAPNPVKGDIHLQITSDYAKDAAVIITDYTGRVILNTSIILRAGNSSIHLPGTGKIEQGVYTITIRHGLTAQSTKFSKLKY
jgi:alpha-L-arabinofuranosidase